MLPSTIEFATDRMVVRHWHRQVRDQAAMLRVIQRLLTPQATSELPAGWQGPFPEGRASDWLAEVGDSLLVAAFRNDDEIAAFLIVFPSEEADVDPTIRIGYVVAEAAWGQGIATELLRGLINHLRDSSPVTLLAGVSGGNRASMRVLEKCGFRQAPPADEREQIAYRLNLD